MRPRILTLLAPLLAALLAASCSSVDASPAATVNGREIDRSELEDELTAIRGNEQYRQAVEQGFQAPAAGVAEGTFDSVFVARVLQLQIYYELLRQELDDLDVQVTADDVDGVRDAVVTGVGGRAVFDEFPERYRNLLVRRQALLEVASDALARAEYEADPEQFAEACVSHILVETGSGERTEEEARERAEELAEQLEEGASFGELAVAESDDPGSGESAGELGCGAPGRFVPEFDEAVFDLPVGEVSDPVQTEFGYHLILVTEREVPPFEQVAEQAARQSLNTFLTEAGCDADIDVNPRFGSWEVDCEGGDQGPGGQGLGQVVPPEGPTTTTSTPSGVTPLPVPEG